MSKARKFFAVVFSVFLSFVAAFADSLPANALSVSAEDVSITANVFDGTSVDEDIDTSLYVANPLGAMRLIYFYEYCFASETQNCGNYGLYLYVYNPQKKDLSLGDGINSVNMAVEYNTDGIPSGYANVPLKLCGKSESETVYKYRVVDTNNRILSNACNQEKANGERRYDIAGIQLYSSGQTVSLVDAACAMTYYYSGFSKGYGNNTESTLECHKEELETVSMEPSFTNYRMGSPYKKTGYSETFMEVNTAYFSVDDYFYSRYGNLQKIHAQWYEYVTSPIFVTEDKATVEGNYSHLEDWIGKYIGEFDDDCKWEVSWDTYGDYFGYSYNLNVNSQVEDNIAVPLMAWFFYTEGKKYTEYEVTKEMMQTYAETYADKYGKEKNILDKYSSDLFATSIDEERIEYLSDPAQKRGLMDLNIDADENHSLLSYDSTHNGFQRFWDYFFLWWYKTNDARDYHPIYEVTRADLSKGKETFCNDLLINEDDYDSVISWATKSISAGDHPILFRYATTDYYLQKCAFDYRPNPFVSAEDGYIAQETVFLNFDVIDLTFRNEKGEETVVPCVMNPVDVFNALTPPQTIFSVLSDLDIWKYLVAAITMIFIVVLVAVFWNPVIFVLKIFWKIVSFPFRLIGKLFRGEKK